MIEAALVGGLVFVHFIVRFASYGGGVQSFTGGEVNEPYLLSSINDIQLR